MHTGHLRLGARHVDAHAHARGELCTGDAEQVGRERGISRAAGELRVGAEHPHVGRRRQAGRLLGDGAHIRVGPRRGGLCAVVPAASGEIEHIGHDTRANVDGPHRADE